NPWHVLYPEGIEFVVDLVLLLPVGGLKQPFHRLIHARELLPGYMIGCIGSESLGIGHVRRRPTAPTGKILSDGLLPVIEFDTGSARGEHFTTEPDAGRSQLLPHEIHQFLARRRRATIGVGADSDLNTIGIPSLGEELPRLLRLVGVVIVQLRR